MMLKSFSISNSATGQTNINTNAPTIIINDPANYLKEIKDNYATKKNENDIEELDEIDRKVLFSSSL